MNLLGDVANEVETEKIVANNSFSNLEKANVASFVQIWVSVPRDGKNDA